MSLRRVLPFLVAMALMSVSAAAAATAKKSPTKAQIAVLALEGLAPAAARAAVERELRALLPTSEYTVQPAATTMATLEAVKSLGLACDSGDVDCLIRVGALTGAAIVLNGALAIDGDGFILELVSADVGGLRERGRVRVNVPASGPERRSALSSAIVGVLRPESWRGQLRVAVAQRGASIVVDGVPRGFSPLSSVLELPPGAHAVFVGLEGFAPWKGSVEVRYGEASDVMIALVPGLHEEAPTFSTKSAPAPPGPVETLKAPRRGPLRVMVYDVEQAGIEPRIAAAIGTFLVAELRKREQVSVLDSSELRALVGEGASTAGDTRGCTEEQCFSEVAEALGADAVVVTSLTQIESQTIFGLRRIDPAKQEVVGSFVGRVASGDHGALLPLVGQSIQATFGDVPLRPGQREGVDERARRILSPPPLPPVLSASLLTGAVVAGLVGSAIGLYALLARQEYDAGVASPAPTHEALGPLGERVLQAQIVAAVSGASAVVLGSAGGIMSPFTDWEGDGAALPSKEGAR